MSDAFLNLRNNQLQADMDGVMVTVSRQALDEVLAEYEQMLERIIRHEAIFDCLETTKCPESHFKSYALSVIAHGPIEE